MSPGVYSPPPRADLQAQRDLEKTTEKENKGQPETIHTKTQLEDRRKTQKLTLLVTTKVLAVAYQNKCYATLPRFTNNQMKSKANFRHENLNRQSSQLSFVVHNLIYYHKDLRGNTTHKRTYICTYTQITHRREVIRFFLIRP